MSGFPAAGRFGNLPSVTFWFVANSTNKATNRPVVAVYDRYQKNREHRCDSFDELITGDRSAYFSKHWDAVRRYVAPMLLEIVRPETIFGTG